MIAIACIVVLVVVAVLLIGGLLALLWIWARRAPAVKSPGHRGGGFIVPFVLVLVVGAM